MTYALWAVQILLTLVFLFTGGMKLLTPIEELTAQMPLPGLFIRFLGLMEVLGGFEAELSGRTFGRDRRRQLEGELESLRMRAQDLVKDVARIGSAVTAQLAQQVHSSMLSVGA